MSDSRQRPVRGGGTMEAMDADAMYAACLGRDARYDGVFYLGVRTTGIYCRPSCPARKPLRGNVDFHPTPAAAQQAGLRACRRCVPEALPGSPSWAPASTVAARALRLIDDGVVDAEGVPALARRLGYSPRNLNRILLAEAGAPALPLARARRARLAHGLVVDTTLSFADVAFAAGFSSVRQFNDTVREVYGTTPTALRHSSRRSVPTAGVLRARLRYRPPLDWDELLAWYERRCAPGVERVEGRTYARTLVLPGGPAAVELTDDGVGAVDAVLHLTDLRDYGPAVAACRRLLDLDADPVGIDAALADAPLLARVPPRPGVRLAGCATPHEALVRAVAGQQVSVTAAVQVVARIVAAAADPLPGPLAGLTHTFPTPDAIAGTVEAWFAGPASRRAAFLAAMDLAASGAVDPSRGLAEAKAAMLATRGIGPWTVGYVALRAYNDPDADLSGDGNLLSWLRRRGIVDDARQLAAMMERCRPWRSYAALRLWAATREETR